MPSMAHDPGTGRWQSDAPHVPQGRVAVMLPRTIIRGATWEAKGKGTQSNRGHWMPWNRARHPPKWPVADRGL